MSDQIHISTAEIHERDSSRTNRKSCEEKRTQTGKGVNSSVDGRSKTKSSKTVKVSSTRKSTRVVDEKSRGNQNDRGTDQTNMTHFKKLTNANKNSIKDHTESTIQLVLPKNMPGSPIFLLQIVRQK